VKAIAVIPGQRGSAHLRDVPEPALEDVPGGCGVLVRVLRVGLDGTDREINAAEYGAPPPGDDHLVLGHESLGMVEAVGPSVTELRPGDRVVAMVRRPGGSRYDAIGLQDFTTDDTYHERGINLLHGYLSERYVDAADYLVQIPERLADVAVLLEPTSVAEKGITQAYEIQRRLRVWQPRRAAVLGAGPLGLLATMALRVRGLEVTTLGLDEAPYLNSDLVEALGARYVSTRRRDLAAVSDEAGPFDLIFEATGFSPLVFEAMRVLGRNGVLVLSSVTGGDRRVEVPADAINLSFVLGNKVAVGTVNASRQDFETAVRDMAIAEARFPGWLSRLVTHVVPGLEGFAEAFELLDGGRGTIKVVVEVAGGTQPAVAATAMGDTRS
jgi:glucose 1-dehydrogenase